MKFKKLLDILRPKKEQRIFDLTESEVRAIRELRASDEWEVFLKVLDMQSTIYGEALLSAPADKMLEIKGHILGLRMAAFLVDEILQKEKEASDNAERRRSNEFRSTDHRTTALYGTPSWS